VINANGKILVPGLVDVHVHFREPGQEYKEDLRTGSLPLLPADHNRHRRTEYNPSYRYTFSTSKLLGRAKEKCVVNFFSKASVTKGLMGFTLTDVGKLKKAGARAISDDGNPVPVIDLCETLL